MYMMIKNAVDRAKAQNHNRLASRRLLAMDEALLRDIGLDPGDLYACVHGLQRP